MYWGVSLNNTWYFYCLFATIGLASCLALGVGPHKPFSYLTQVAGLAALIILGFKKDYAILDKHTFIILTMGLLLLASSLFADEYEYPKRTIKNIVAWVFIGIACYHLPNRKNVQFTTLISHLIFALTTITTIAQSVALLKLGYKYGYFDNPHFLALQNLVAIIIAMYFIWQGMLWQKFIALLVLCMNTYILIEMSSGAAGAGLLTGISCTLILASAHKKWVRLVTIATLIAALTVVATYEYNPQMQSKYTVDSFITIKDERPIIWLDAWKLQLESSPKQWLIGHSYNAFTNNFVEFSHYKTPFVFPHNFFLEILYTSGIIALLLFISILSYTFYHLCRIYMSTKSAIALLAFCLTIAVGIHIFLTLPLFSRYGTHCLALVLGFCFWTIKDAQTTAD